MHALIDRNQDHERQDHDRSLGGKAHEIVERLLQIGPNPSRQHGAQSEPKNQPADSRKQYQHRNPLSPPPVHVRSRVAEHSITLADLAKGRQPTVLATLAAVFAALPLCDERPMPVAAIHARVATWSESCTGRCLRQLALAGIAERTLAPATHHGARAPANLYRRTRVETFNFPVP